MNNKALKTLEYTKIIDMLASHATSEPGRKLCCGLMPSIRLAEIEQAQENTQDALSRIFKKGSTSFGGNYDIGFSVKSLEIGASLSQTELLKIALFLENVNRIKTYGRNNPGDESTDSLTDYFNNLAPLTSLANEIARCILSEEEIADDASSALKKIRRSMVLANDKIHTELNKMVNGSYRTYLQDAVITMRDNRYCLPVKSEYKNQISGMVHDQSTTGSTFFIEPAGIVNLNNQLRELELQEKEEIEIILATLSTQAGEHKEELQQNSYYMTKLDFIFAKGHLALELNGSRPDFNENHIINIKKGRHPLIDKGKVVPIDIQLGDDFDLLIVTGPNTGGKTVSLKTVGLFTLMGQSGLHIPALDHSMLSIFKEVFADIGDEQSIEQSLSTFSSHMTGIVHILKHADSHSLCLFDELGAGTDPTEGAALAISILDYLHTRGIRSMATTHYSELKVYALSTPFVENACCEFDVETLRPTYKILVGIPGKSNAFAISSKLGLPDHIIEAAKKQISIEDTGFENLLADLENNRRTIEKEQLEIKSYKDEIKTLKERLELKNEKIDNSRDKILREAREEARDILSKAKETADETIRIFQSAGPGASMKDLEKSRDQIRSKVNETNSKLALQPAGSKNPAKAVQPDKLKIGDSVKIISLGLKGTVSSLPDHKGNLFVQCGIMRTQTNVKELMLIEDDDSVTQHKVQRKTGAMKMGKSMTIRPEINLLGKTVDEALSELDKYLDDAYLAHLTSVRIVHGKGTGALRSAVQSHLKRVKYIKSYRLGEYGEGDAGVTIAEFKEI